MTAKITEIQTGSDKAGDALKQVEKRLADMAVLIKNVSTFQKTKPAYDTYQKKSTMKVQNTPFLDNATGLYWLVPCSSNKL